MYREDDELVRKIDNESRLFEHSLNPVFRKQTGSYYTSMYLAIPMVRELIDNLSEEKRQRIHTLKFLEPCVGTGNFVFAYILVVSELLHEKQINELLNNLYVCDTNQQALEQYKERLKIFARSRYHIELTSEYFDSHAGGALLFDVLDEKPHYISIDDVFGLGSLNAFDIIVTNPPYKNLKAELAHYESDIARNRDKKKYEIISQSAKAVLPLSSRGTLNLYKLFVEEIFERYAAADALVALLLPSSILADKTCEGMRAKMITAYHLVSVKNIPESNEFISAQQALSALLVDKNSSATDRRLTNIYKAYSARGEEPAGVYVRDFATRDNGYSILVLNQRELQILQKMTAHPKVKDIPFIVNLRGELDLTMHKGSITNKKTSYRLLRGRDIGRYRFAIEGATDYVAHDFVMGSSKKNYIDSERIACQQVSNMAKKRRLAFTRIAPMTVLANSCNFISVKPNDFGIDEDYIVGLMNSQLMDWYFRLHNSNNHISNYEIDNFPVPLKGKAIKSISRMAAKIRSELSVNDKDTDEIDKLVNDLFDINNNDGESLPFSSWVSRPDSPIFQKAFSDMSHIVPRLHMSDVQEMIRGSQSLEATLIKKAPSLSKFEKKVFEGMFEKYKKLYEGNILNHTTFKLSDLDLEMIRSVPQGGNWKNIPAATVGKSRRLERITQTGGRTTLYGRLHYERPSYTITTYFNRPGNGTYVHPKHDRVLSVREAARFQAFADDYYFYGNKTQLLKQIGNAVPTLLAYQIGRKIVNYLGSVKSADLFCGAGGLTNGFGRAGIEAAVCTDYDEAACTTIKINNPQARVVCGDITDESIKAKVIEKILGDDVQVVCGGPPCQGFSMAGYRNEKDPRNQLFKEFVAIVERTKPKVVLFENVEGILTFKNGETYTAIHQLFTELGYKTEGRLLKIDRFGVPQKRKRVIIICTRSDLNINPSNLYPDELTVDDASKITVSDSILDLEDVECSENARYVVGDESRLPHYNKMLRGLITIEEFLGIINPMPLVVSDAEQLALLNGFEQS